MLSQEHGHCGQQLPRVLYQVRCKVLNTHCSATCSMVCCGRPISTADFVVLPNTYVITAYPLFLIWLANVERCDVDVSLQCPMVVTA